MRKSRKTKRRSCQLCKPNKMGFDIRWNQKEFVTLRRVERQIRQRTYD